MDTVMTADATLPYRNRSGSLNELAAALAKAQGEMQGAKKENKAVITGQTQRTYADLASVWEAVREPLTKNGLSIVQFPRTAGEGVEIETTILHTSGQFMSDVLWVPCSKNDAQGLGSAITYGRRYALMAVTGIAPVDDDGAAAVAAVPGSARGMAGGGGDFRPPGPRQGSANGHRMAAEEPELVAAAAGHVKGAPANGKKTPAEKAKEFTDEGVKFFAKHKDDEAACKVWWTENTKVAAGASASPIGWLLAKAPTEHRRLQDAYEGVVGLEDAA